MAKTIKQTAKKAKKAAPKVADTEGHAHKVSTRAAKAPAKMAADTEGHALKVTRGSKIR